jgi:hypothetical protein
MSQLFLTNFSIIVIRYTSKTENDKVYYLGNQSIIRKQDYMQAAKFFSHSLSSKAKSKINSFSSKWKAA